MDDSDPTCNYAFQTLTALKTQPKKTVLVCAVSDQCESTGIEFDEQVMSENRCV